MDTIYITPETQKKLAIPTDSGDYTYIDRRLEDKREKDILLVLDARIKELSERVARIEAWQDSMTEFIRQAFSIVE